MTMHELFDGSEHELIKRAAVTKLRRMAHDMAETAGLLSHLNEAHAAQMEGAAKMAGQWADAIEAEADGGHLSTEDLAMCGLLSEIDDD